MATKFAEATIRGRLGAYTFELFDGEEEYDTVRRLELGRPVVIEWGEQGREYPQQILKSRTRLKVSEGAGIILDALRGGFDRRRFTARITGPGVAWSGFVEPESRTLPYTRRTRPTQVGLLISDDANFAKNESQSDIAEIFGATTKKIEQWSGTFFNGVEQSFDQTDVRRNGFPFGESPYERHTSFAQLMGARVYRALSEDTALLHELRATGQSVTGYRSALDPDAAIPGRVVEPRPGAIEDREEAFRDVEQAGTIQINLGSEYNLAYVGATEILQLEGDTLIRLNRNDRPSIDLNVDKASSNNALVRCFLGSINPTPNTPLGIRVSWEQVDDVTSGDELTVTLRDGNGNTDSVSGTSGGEVSLPPNSDPVDFKVDFEGKGVIVSDIQAVYTDSLGRRIETLFDRTSPTGVERIELNRLDFAFVERPDTTPQQYLAGFLYEARRMEHPLFNEDLGFLARAQMIRQYRPFGIQSVQTKLKGLYGPEDLLILEAPEPNGTRRAPFVCGKGRKVNLTAGTTEISDVEIPSEILPTSVL